MYLYSYWDIHMAISLRGGLRLHRPSFLNGEPIPGFEGRMHRLPPAWQSKTQALQTPPPPPPPTPPAANRLKSGLPPTSRSIRSRSVYIYIYIYTLSEHTLLEPPILHILIDEPFDLCFL